jgi:Na+/melibiose symporter-like transporter
LVAVPRTRTQAVRPLAGLTAAVWAVALIAIWARDHAIGFKVVHTVIAAISIALAVAAVRAVREVDDASVGLLADSDGRFRP